MENFGGTSDAFIRRVGMENQWSEKFKRVRGCDDGLRCCPELCPCHDRPCMPIALTTNATVLEINEDGFPNNGRLLCLVS